MTKKSTDSRLYDLEFGVEVSTRYHEWRRASYEGWSAKIRVFTFVGATTALVTVFSSVGLLGYWIIGVSSAFIGVLNLADFVFEIDRKARQHTDLYQRFKRLQAEIAKHRENWEQHINEWDAEAQSIRVDEPTVYWTIYIRSWNQALNRRKINALETRKISWWQSLTAKLLKHHPQDFPTMGELQSPTRLSKA